ncbi:MAG: hypothetical protein COX77_03725 [Candidatus Komeilibacteria bacterium CG_4_10_14_0_2_um_filter_37_10]|uniref:Glycosyltransferase family 1 protein n=1 Tax=Candidatus Komeilibacteria bacterium CG_4_10_14_0_2_um_filter_37_10 TaxID=1974470 RepID=A0A2M7VDY9_9BACT|nr:MAG: hypothetical protein COX77_03725 [Candidatus Komeilibacteria bacterium CG_4_10_14_0_2_um_filter_37_10]
MKILLINKFHYLQGGADRHYLELGQELEKQGHQMHYFSMHHPNNLVTSDQKYFVDYLNFGQLHFDLTAIKKIFRLFYSWQARCRLAKLLRQWQPDIAHLHNIYHQLSPSIISLLKKRGIPTVMTVHDYYLINPNYNLFHQNQIFDPQRNLYWQVLKNKAIKDSYLASLVDIVAHFWHRHYYRKIDCFVCPSKYLARRLQLVYPQNKIIILPNFTFSSAQNYIPTNYFVYVGRISKEKGVATLLQVAAQLPRSRFVIVGEGPARVSLQKQYALTNVEWLGQQSSDKISKIIGQARALLIPSEWPENCPLVILESFATGTPVIASNIGGIPELVIDQFNGLLFKSGDQMALQQNIEKISSQVQLREQLRQGASNSFSQYTFAIYYQKLMSIYESLL